MIKIFSESLLAFAALFLIYTLPSISESRAETIDNDWLAMEIQDNWEILPGSSAPNDAALSLILRDKDGGCSINIDIIPYAGSAAELARRIREEQRAAKIVVAEIEEKDGVYFYRVKKGNTAGLVYIGSNGERASMVTIYGIRKKIKRAQKLLSEVKMKQNLIIYPSE